jgi:nucleoside-diphosphate-sugar epimerase
MKRARILVIGAGGQIGSELVTALRKVYGAGNVVSADVKIPVNRRSGEENGKGQGDGRQEDCGQEDDGQEDGPYELLDVLNRVALSALVAKYEIREIYLLAAMLSATGERHPQRAWQLNMQGLLHVLDLAKEKKLHKVFWPSSIAVFGPDAPRHHCPQDTALRPTTVYGISKAAGENWCRYYYEKHGVDVRSLRYPGLISYLARPGGGTTDYAVDIYQQALEARAYTCYLRADTELPMMYMPDAIRATLELMAAPADALTVRTSYNIAAISVTPAKLAMAIRLHVPEFRLSCEPDWRQDIADSWPGSIDDAAAHHDFGWEHMYGVRR